MPENMMSSFGRKYVGCVVPCLLLMGVSLENSNIFATAFMPARTVQYNFQMQRNQNRQNSHGMLSINKSIVGEMMIQNYHYHHHTLSSPKYMSSNANDSGDVGDGGEGSGENPEYAPSDVENEEEDYDESEPAFGASSEFDTIPNGVGEWEEMHGNYVLRPPTSYDRQPRALIHFLGGAIVGAAPDISYRYLLERLAQKGFLIVATPYTLSFDYIATCDDIIGRFERIAPALARQFGPVPVVGVGHSCGALLQLLITTLFPDTPRAANALMSYNNKGVKDAIPFFDELFAPLFVSLAKNETNPLVEFLWTGSTGSEQPSEQKSYPPTSLDLINIGIELGRNAVRGNLPSDDLLSDIAKKTTPKPLASVLPQDVQIPSFIRDSVQKALDPLVEAQSEAGITPILDQSLDVLEQIPSLIEEVADGARDFNPPPASVKAAARRSYRARRTLVIEYDNDPLDESEELEALLKDAESVMRNKRPMVDFDVQRAILKGGHATPCIAPPLDLASRAEDILGDETAKDKLLYSGADETVDELVRWLEEGNL